MEEVAREFLQAMGEHWKEPIERDLHHSARRYLPSQDDGTLFEITRTGRRVDACVGVVWDLLAPEPGKILVEEFGMPIAGKRAIHHCDEHRVPIGGRGRLQARGGLEPI